LSVQRASPSILSIFSNVSGKMVVCDAQVSPDNLAKCFAIISPLTQ